MMRKLEQEEILHFSELMSELKKLYEEIVTKKKEVDPYAFILINDNLEQAVSCFTDGLLLK